MHSCHPVKRSRQLETVPAAGAHNTCLCRWPCSECCLQSCQRPHPQLPPHSRRWAGSQTASARRPPAGEGRRQGNSAGECSAVQVANIVMYLPCRRQRAAAATNSAACQRTSPTPTPSSIGASPSCSSPGRSRNVQRTSTLPPAPPPPLPPLPCCCCEVQLRLTLPGANSKRSRPAAFHLQATGSRRSSNRKAVHQSNKLS